MDTDNLYERLTGANSSACVLCDKLVRQSRCDNGLYRYFDLFTELLRHKNSLVRNRAIALLAANAKWDVDNRFERIIGEYLSHITDAKPITARQCVKALPEVALEKPELKNQILSALRSADVSKYADSMRPLVEKDIKSSIHTICK